MSNLGKLARPYAKAAFEQALEQGTNREWLETLKLLASAVETSDLAKIIKDPRFEPAQISEMLMALGKNKFSEPQRRFIELLSERNRLQLLPDIAKQFADMLTAMEKIVEAKVTSAVPLSSDYEKSLMEILSKKFNSHVTLDTTVDPSILGGVIIRIGDRVFDASLQGQLQHMKRMLINKEVHTNATT